MPESPLLYSTVIAACGLSSSAVKKSGKANVKESTSREVEERKPRARCAPRQAVLRRREPPADRESCARAAGQRADGWLVDFRTFAFSTANRRNKARMFMKTKEKYKMSRVAAERDTSPGSLLSPRCSQARGTLITFVFGSKKCGNELRKSLRTKGDGYYKLQNRTQNEHVFEQKMRELSSNSRCPRIRKAHTGRQKASARIRNPRMVFRTCSALMLGSTLSGRR